MINVKIKNHDLIVEDSSQTIFDWENSAFFNVYLDFNEDKKNNSYYFSYTDKIQLSSIVRDIVNHFTEEGMEYNVDSEVGVIIKSLQESESEFIEAKSNTEKNITLSPSDSFKRQLKPYQEESLKHFLRVKHGANFSVPGSGKTTMVYSYFDRLRQEGIVEKILVIGPFSSFMPWEEESKECFGRKLKTARLVGEKRESYYFTSEKYDLFLCSYQTLPKDINPIIALCQEHRMLMVADESHYIKRFEGGKWVDALLKIAPYAKRRVVLSGTPMPNSYLDLWSQITFLWPGKQLLGERAVYKNRCNNVQEQERVKEEIRPFFSRVKKSDLKLPKQNILEVKCILNPIQEKIYEALSTRFLTDLKLQTDDRQKLKQWRSAKMIRLMQTASNPSLLHKPSDEFDVPPLPADGTSLIELIEKYNKFETPAKIEKAVSLTKDFLSQDKKVLLWTSFVHNIKMLEVIFSDSNFYSIHGGVPKNCKENEEYNREKQIQEFKNTNKPSLLIANPAACAESISLHKVCHDAIYLDRTFNCGQFIQSLDRIHRIGSDQDVNYHILIAESTIDDTIHRRLNEKWETMIGVLEDDVPLGGFDVDSVEDDEADFNATIEDIKKFNRE